MRYCKVWFEENDTIAKVEVKGNSDAVLDECTEVLTDLKAKGFNKLVKRMVALNTQYNQFVLSKV